MGGEGGKEQRAVGGVLVVGVAADIKIVSQVYLHFFFFYNICVHLQNISTIIVFNTQKKYAFFTSKGDGGENFPFSHKRKLMSLISLYNFIANISFLILLVTISFFHLERKWKRKGGGGRRRDQRES